MDKETIKTYRYGFNVCAIACFILLILFIFSFCKNVSSCSRISFMPIIIIIFNMYSRSMFESWYVLKLLKILKNNDKTILGINFINLLFVNFLNMYYLMKYIRINLIVYGANMLYDFMFYCIIFFIVLCLKGFIKATNELAYYIKH